MGPITYDSSAELSYYVNDMLIKNKTLRTLELIGFQPILCDAMSTHPTLRSIDLHTVFGGSTIDVVHTIPFLNASYVLQRLN